MFHKDDIVVSRTNHQGLKLNERYVVRKIEHKNYGIFGRELILTVQNENGGDLLAIINAEIVLKEAE